MACYDVCTSPMFKRLIRKFGFIQMYTPESLLSSRKEFAYLLNCLLFLFLFLMLHFSVVCRLGRREPPSWNASLIQLI